VESCCEGGDEPSGMCVGAVVLSAVALASQLVGHVR
jgi:hypothetical protein